MPLYNLQKNTNLKFFLAENRRLSRIGIFRTKRPVSRGPTHAASQMGMCAQPIFICHGMRISARGSTSNIIMGVGVPEAVSCY